MHNHYGYQNLDSMQKINQESVFEIASISKQFTALLIMMLQEEGLLSYDDKVLNHLVEFPYGNITIRHLLTHTSGLSERQFFIWAAKNMDPSKIYTNEFIMTYLQQENPPLAFEPGQKWEYSNLGYFLLPLVIKQATGRDYIDLLKTKILEPLEMNRSGIFSQEYKGSEMPNYVFGKVMNPADSSYISSFGMAWSDSLYGGVGILSNAADLWKWDRALYSDQLLSQKQMAEAFKPYTLSNDSSSQYGFGWYIRENSMINGINVGKRLDHNGLWPGYESSIVRYIDQEKTIILLANQAPSSKDQLVDEISELIF